MKITSTKTIHAVFSDYRKYSCVVFFICISVFTRAQIYQASNSLLYISEGTSITEISNDKQTDNTEQQPGKIFVSKNTLICIDNDATSAEVVFIESSKKDFRAEKNLASLPKTVKVKSEEVAKPITNSDFKIATQTFDANFRKGSAHENNGIVNTNDHLRGIIAKIVLLYPHQTLCRPTDNFFIKIEDNIKNDGNSFSIRPPPAI